MIFAEAQLDAARVGRKALRASEAGVPISLAGRAAQQKRGHRRGALLQVQIQLVTFAAAR